MDYTNLVLPKHLGIIMDGNGRWATEKQLTRSQGHKAGAKNLKRLLTYIYDKKIPCVSIYAFSTENFKRDKKEVDYLMKLFITIFQKEFLPLKEKGVKVVFSGRKENIPKDVLNAMEKLEQETKDNNQGILNICLNYGGQYEIVDMTKKIVEQILEGKITKEEITKEWIEKNLYQQLPPLDFVIRTSGELRTSNFMIYQSAYAEYYFPKTYFPDFNEEQLDIAILEYNKRKRRFGGN